MERNLTILLAAGIILTAISFFFSFYAAAIVFIITAVLAMSVFIMQDSSCLPNVDASLSEDAKSVIIRNAGNAPAYRIHVALVPENVEFDIPSLDADASFTKSFGTMISQVKAVIVFENEKGQSFSRTCHLSSSGDAYEPLKPMIPIFGWK